MYIYTYIYVSVRLYVYKVCNFYVKIIFKIYNLIICIYIYKRFGHFVIQKTCELFYYLQGMYVYVYACLWACVSNPMRP